MLEDGGAGLFSASPIILISNLLDLYSIADIIADYYDTAVNTEKAGMVNKISFSAAIITAVLPVIWPACYDLSDFSVCLVLL